MSSRYHGKNKKTTDLTTHKELLERRATTKINHFETPKLNHPTPEQREQMTQSAHVWKEGDRFFKLAHHHYGDSKYWWVIACWNLRPTEAHVKIGEVLRIPGPLGQVMSILKRKI